MKSNFVDLSKHPAGSGNYNYGLFCGHKDTLQTAKEFVYELLEKFGITDKNEVKSIIIELEQRCEIKAM